MNNDQPSSSALALLLNSQELETLLGVAPGWAAKARVSGQGPVFVKIGRSVRYRAGDVEEFLQAAVRKSTSELGASK